jgi:hypothetical protein
MDVVPTLTDSDLEQIGVKLQGHRLKLLRASRSVRARVHALALGAGSAPRRPTDMSSAEDAHQHDVEHLLDTGVISVDDASKSVVDDDTASTEADESLPTALQSFCLDMSDLELTRLLHCGRRGERVYSALYRDVEVAVKFLVPRRPRVQRRVPVGDEVAAARRVALHRDRDRLRAGAQAGARHRAVLQRQLRRRHEAAGRRHAVVARRARPAQGGGARPLRAARARAAHRARRRARRVRARHRRVARQADWRRTDDAQAVGAGRGGDRRSAAPTRSRSSRCRASSA